MKPKLTLKQIRALMKIGLESSPCEITVREEPAPNLDEEREFMSVRELWRDRKEMMNE